ncbi:MAG: hypothetical protein QOJ84_4570 [Bradyrhizobium sp.]|nr:hypothetical protein [Bradyrhizobium sp.]
MAVDEGGFVETKRSTLAAPYSFRRSLTGRRNKESRAFRTDASDIEGCIDLAGMLEEQRRPFAVLQGRSKASHTFVMDFLTLAGRPSTFPRFAWSRL